MILLLIALNLFYQIFINFLAQNFLTMDGLNDAYSLLPMRYKIEYDPNEISNKGCLVDLLLAII
jgi:hypothetical protein